MKFPGKNQGKADVSPSSGFDDDLNISSFTNPEEKFILSSSEDKKQKKEKKEKKYRSKFHKIMSKIGMVIATFFLIGIITTCILGATLTIYILAFSSSDVEFDLNVLKLQYTTIVYANDEKGEPQELERLHSVENREWADLADIPEELVNAFIAIEDSRFESHKGVDWKRTFAAFGNIFMNYFETQQGGSTITQQLIKNVLNDKEDSYDRKMREILRALELEKKATKDQIMEAYLNTINLGCGSYGIQTASSYYFGKELKDLTVTECACLAGITRNPNKNNPAQGLDKSRERTAFVLKQMKNQGYIKTDEEYEKCLEEAKNLTPTEKKAEEAKPPQSYYVDMVINDVIADLMEEKGYEREYASSLLFSGGLRIYTNMDSTVQSTMEAHFVDPKNFPSGKSKAPSGKKDDIANGQSMQSAMMIMDYEGKVLGVVGGVGVKEGNRTNNRATQSPRQPGSSIKPLSAYAPAMELNKIYYSKFISDQPTATIDGKQWPKNWYGSYSSSLIVTKAIEKSANAAPTQLVVNVLTKQFSFDFLTTKLGITTLVKSKTIDGKIYSDIDASSLGVGGMTYGVKVSEMTAAFATFGNLGHYYKPQSYSKVETFKGEIILEKTNKNFTIAMGEDTSYIMNKLLRLPIVGSEGTGKAAAFGDYPIFGKTGTTTDDYDKWFCGGTPFYVGAVWSGFDYNADLKRAGIGDSVSTATWKSVMEKVHKAKGLKPKDYPTTTKVEYRKYCTSSGRLATTTCTGTAWGYYKKSSSPGKCPSHGGELLPAEALPKFGESSSSSKSSTDSSSSTAASSSVSSAAAVSSSVTTAPPKNSEPAPPESKEPETSVESKPASSAAPVSSTP